jgi:uncharacterized repeat protein (TIGR01451 family)
LIGGGLLLVLGLPFVQTGEANLAEAYGPPNSGETTPHRTFHLWRINEIFSCADGSEQFIEFVTDSNSQQFLTGQPLTASNLGGTQTKTFIFPTDSGAPTQGHSLLLATPGFASLPGGITPDFVIPTGFLFTGGGTLAFGNPLADTFDYGAGELPLDNVQSLNRNKTTGVNSPTNFAGQTGSVTCPDPILSVSKQAQSAIVQPGDLISYTLTVMSTGTLSNTNTILTDTIPASTTFVSATGGIMPNNDVLTWTLGDLLPPSTVVTRTFVVSPNVSAGQTIVNAEYGVQSDQTSATGLPLETLVTTSLDVYLPIILKAF